MFVYIYVSIDICYDMLEGPMDGGCSNPISKAPMVMVGSTPPEACGRCNVRTSSQSDFMDHCAEL